MRQAVQVKGLNETRRKLERLGVSVDDLKGALQRVGAKAVSDAIALTPKRSGALASSIRQNKAKSKALIKAGTAKLYYASFIEFGTGKIGAVEMLTRAAQGNATYMAQQLERELSSLIRKYDLD